jgi:26S proteasome regulatory subunit N12
MTEVRKQVTELFKQLEKEWKAKKDSPKVGQLLAQLKIGLTQITFLPTTTEGMDRVTLLNDLLLARSILEIGCEYSVYTRDIPSFERFIAQLKTYYFDYKEDLQPSAYMYRILGLNLLRLLSQNRVADFHTELELLPLDIKEACIECPVKLEQWLMEGRYNKIFLSRRNVPHESYTFFLDILLNTIRVEIASCIEAAYDQITLSEAARVLFFNQVQEIDAFIRSQGKTWTLEGNHLIFSNNLNNKDRTIERLPSLQLMQQTITYARELEMIV